MRLFVCEYLTGGGLRDSDLPPDLLRDARRMADALLTDLADIADLELVTTRDDRVTGVGDAIPVADGTDAESLWRDCMQDCDAAWIIAPETGGMLLRMRRLADASGCAFIGCDEASIAVTASKTRTMDHLARTGINCIETSHVHAAPPHGENGWVIKPDDGAGCEETFFLETEAALRDWLSRHRGARAHILQPHIRGDHASLSVLYTAGGCELLACNAQRIVLDGNRIRLDGVDTGRRDGDGHLLLPLARAAGRSLPGLRGYVGMDVIITDHGPVLVEINPRLTTAYAGLREVLGVNPAEKILRALGYLTA